MHQPGSAPAGLPSQELSEAERVHLLQRIDELEHQVDTLREGMRTRERIGVAVGLLAQRHGSTPEEAWTLLSTASQTLNVRVRRIADVVHDVWSGRLSEEDVELAGRLSRVLPAVAQGEERS